MKTCDHEFMNFMDVKIKNFELKMFDILIFGTKRGGSHKYPQSVFWVKHRNVYPFTP